MVEERGEEAAVGEDISQHEGHRDPGVASTITDTESYYTRAKRASRLHGLLSHHHRTDGEGVQVPVGDIPQVEGREGRLSGPHSRLQYLMDTHTHTHTHTHIYIYIYIWNFYLKIDFKIQTCLFT